jgi:hypothetical protein
MTASQDHRMARLGIVEAADETGAMRQHCSGRMICGADGWRSDPWGK